MQHPADIAIFLIEDNPFDAELTIRALQRKGLAGKVKVFPDGVEALDFLFCNCDQTKPVWGEPDVSHPKVIFLDLKLPKMGGLEVLSQIKQDKRTRLIPVVVLTSSQEESDILESYQLGANSYMVKPVNYDEFLRVVEELGVYWAMRNTVAIA